MKITKLGHSCLIIEIKEINILIDPGSWTIEQHQKIKDIDIILITHKHADHLHLESFKEIIKNNPEAAIYTNSDVGEVLSGQGISFKVLEGIASAEAKGIKLEAFDCEHEEIYSPVVPLPKNTGYFIDEKFFYPGDSLTEPNRDIEIMGLPIAGPFMTLAQGIDYAKKVKPKKCFPMHDGMIKEESLIIYYKITQKALEKDEIEFVPIEIGNAVEF